MLEAITTAEETNAVPRYRKSPEITLLKAKTTVKITIADRTCTISSLFIYWRVWLFI
jgi:hypothetical protein